MEYSVSVDQDTCMSTGNCIRNAPGAFAFDEDDISTPQPAAADLPLEKLLLVVRSCPVGAIHLFADGEEVDPYAA